MAAVFGMLVVYSCCIQYDIVRVFGSFFLSLLACLPACLSALSACFARWLALLGRSWCI